MSNNLKDMRDYAYKRAQELNAKGAQLTEDEISEFEVRVAEVKNLDEKLAKVKAADETFDRLNGMSSPEADYRAVNGIKAETSLGAKLDMTKLATKAGDVTKQLAARAKAGPASSGAVITDIPLVEGVVEPPKTLQHIWQVIPSIKRAPVYNWISGDAVTPNAKMWETGEKSVTSVGVTTHEEHLRVVATISDELDNYQGYDHPELLSYVNNKLLEALYIELERQLFLGNGTAPNLNGLVGAETLTTASDTDILTTLLNAQAAVENNGVKAAAFVLSVNDSLELQKSKNGNDDYRFGGVIDRTARTVWGTPWITSTVLEDGSAYLIGADTVRLGSDGAIRVTGSNDGGFSRNTFRILAETRASVEVMKPYGVSAISLATGS